MGWVLVAGVVAVAVHALAQVAAARALRVKPLYLAPRTPRRAAALGAGIVGNFLAAALVVFITVLAGGKQILLPEVIEATAGGPAEGLLAAGDVIAAVDGRVCLADELGTCIAASGGRPLVLEIERQGERRVVTVTPRQVDGRWRIGLKFSSDRRQVRVGAGEAARLGIAFPVDATRRLARRGWASLTGRDDDAAGPVGIVHLVRRTPHWTEQVRFAAFILVAVGFVLLLVDALVFAVARLPRRR